MCLTLLYYKNSNLCSVMHLYWDPYGSPTQNCAMSTLFRLLHVIELGPVGLAVPIQSLGILPRAHRDAHQYLAHSCAKLA